MIRKFSFLITGVALGTLATTFFIQKDNSNLSVVSPALAASSETYRQLDLFGNVFERIQSDYVSEPEEKKLIENAINGMLSSLDPHSSYLPPKNFQDMQVQTRGEFGGLGIEVEMKDGLVHVVTPIDDTPAANAGVLSGDLISHLDGTEIQGLTLNEAVEKMRGKVKEPIELTIIRKGAEEPIKLTVIRDIIKIRSVRSNIEGADGKVGYIRITQFTEQTFSGLKKSIEKLNEDIGEDIKGYVVDLRNNPGGLLDQSISVSDAFLDQGEIVSTRGRNPEQMQRSNARKGDLTNGLPIVVLINGGSASASEIVAGALQDHARATIIGSRSFGKGSVQTILPLGAHGAIRLTTARYYTPSGRSIQAKGIAPDIEVEQPLPEELKGLNVSRSEASLRGHLSNGEEEEKGSSAYVPREKEKDEQLKYALKLLRGEIEHSMFPPDANRNVPN